MIVEVAPSLELVVSSQMSYNVDKNKRTSNVNQFQYLLLN